ncbi:MAG: carboxypeptidase regulatory-like domain-containing protein, partial [Kofleriaceae bacterium]|nr:carboxypeptidase regulatory-like domain-containing protein [Kofleriaceae bacterium]
RAEGRIGPLPFTFPLISAIYRGDYEDMRAAIDYVLEPGSEFVDIYISYRSPRKFPEDVPAALHGFMYTKRMRPFARNTGFEPEGQLADLSFIDDTGPSFSYAIPGDTLEAVLSVSGFALNLGEGFTIDACGETRRLHARLTIGGSGVDGIVTTLADVEGTTLREISGVVRDAQGSPAEGVRVHAISADDAYLTRATSDADGSYRLHVPDGLAVSLVSYRVGDESSTVDVAAAQSQADITLAATGTISVTSIDQDTQSALPVRIQLFPTTQNLNPMPSHYGEKALPQGRLHVEYSMDGTADFRVPVGEWEIVVSRGYEYELFSELVTVTANNSSTVSASLEHVVNTPGELCADFHIHTIRSADSGDDVLLKLRSAIADGLELPVRSEHEYAASFAAEIAELGVEDWAYGVPSVELTTMEFAGHFGVLPTMPDVTKRNGGAPIWQRFTDLANPTRALETMLPPEIFSTLRALPERPAIIINHPRGGANYFAAAGFDPTSGMPSNPDYWDEDFNLVEVFNDSDWQANFSETVADWLALLSIGRRVFAVGSSDSHAISNSPVGYPRTCLALGSDDPRAMTNDLVRDTTAAGQSRIVGGIFVDASVNGVGPGGDATGLGANTQLHLVVQAASWVDVDSIDIVVDGVTTTIAILPADADPTDPSIRFEKDIDIAVSSDPNAYVIVAAYGDQTLEPVHRGRIPFGVSNPIFLAQ